MKKILSALRYLVVMTVLLSSYNIGKADNVSVSKIINKAKTETLTQSDYGTLIDYIDGALVEIVPVIEKAQEAAANGDATKLTNLTQKIQNLQAKYNKLEDAIDIIDEANEKNLSTAIKDKRKKTLKKLMDAGIL